MIIFEAALRDFAVLYRFADCTTGIGIVLAVAIFAVTEIIMEFDKTVGNLFRFEMPEAKLAHARRINHIAALREVVEARGGGGVLAQT